MHDSEVRSHEDDVPSMFLVFDLISGRYLNGGVEMTYVDAVKLAGEHVAEVRRADEVALGFFEEVV